MTILDANGVAILSQQEKTAQQAAAGAASHTDLAHAAARSVYDNHSPRRVAAAVAAVNAIEGLTTADILMVMAGLFATASEPHDGVWKSTALLAVAAHAQAMQDISKAQVDAPASDA